MPFRLSRYFGVRFLIAVTAVFGGIFVLVALVEYVELMRKASDIPNVSAWLVAKAAFYQVPQVTERLLPFSVLVAAMTCYLSLSRRLELVIARAAGISAWQFVAPALIGALIIGVLATTLYNPLSAALRERSKRLEAEIFGEREGLQQSLGGGYYWVRQKSADGQSIMDAQTSRQQGIMLGGVTVFTFDSAGSFRQRIEAKTAELESGRWRLEQARIYGPGSAPKEAEFYSVSTNLTPEQVRESFATPETVSFWQLPLYIELAEEAGLAGAGYRLQYQLLLVRPFYLSAMVLLAASVSLRFFRIGGVSRMVLSGIGAGFLLYVLAKVSEDLSKAELMHPMAAAWLPVLVGGLTGFVVLLYQEDG